MPPAPKPPRRVKVRKPLKAQKVSKRFAARRVPEYQEWIRGFACILWGKHDPENAGPVECAHVKSRAAGGDDCGNIVPLCRAGHRELHTIGIRSFNKKYDLDLYAIAADLGRLYTRRTAKRETT